MGQHGAASGGTSMVLGGEYGTGDVCWMETRWAEKRRERAWFVRWVGKVLRRLEIQQ
jgi:hypothetical protein